MDFTTTLTVDPTPDEAFSEEIDGATDELGAEFTYTYQDLHRSTQQITELIPGKRVVWHVLDSYLDFVADKPSGTAPTSPLTSPRGMAGPKSGPPTLVSLPKPSASRAAPALGASTSTAARAV